MVKAAAIVSVQKKTKPTRRFSIHVSNRFGLKDRVDRAEFKKQAAAL
jgi:hypothetical protein